MLTFSEHKCLIVLVFCEYQGDFVQLLQSIHSFHPLSGFNQNRNETQSVEGPDSLSFCSQRFPLKGSVDQV